MPKVSAERVVETKRELLDAAKSVLSAEGFSGLSTRRVAEAAGTRMSQIQYHFGSKEGMILALFQHMNDGLIERQSEIFRERDLTVSQKWARACDYLDEDIASGYVRVLQELIAAGWANPNIRTDVRNALAKWHELLSGLAAEAVDRHGPLGGLSADGLASLIASTFIGAEALFLLGYEDEVHPIRKPLRQVGDLLATLEQGAG